MRAWLLVSLAVLGVGCPDEPGWECEDPEAWSPGPEGAAEVQEVPVSSAVHVDLDETPAYSGDIPSGGDHWPVWAKWGAYSRLEYGYWTHNLEHGGIALLHHPCADPATVDAQRAWARAVPDDDGGAFRWIQTPFPGLPAATAAVAWGWNLTDDDVDTTALDAFVADHYRRAPEDVAGDGAYDTGWTSE